MEKKAIATVEKFIKAVKAGNAKKMRRLLTVTNQKQMTTGEVRNRMARVIVPEDLKVLGATVAGAEAVVDVQTTKGKVRCIAESGYHKANPKGHLGVNFQSATKMFEAEQEEHASV